VITGAAKLLVAAAAAPLVESCARFPSTPVGQFTKITFSVTMGGPINPNYLYFVAMYASTDPNPVLPQNGPVPVLSTGSTNGWLTGSATQFVSLTPLSGGRPYTIYNVGTPSDPGVDNVPTRNLDDTLIVDGSGNYPSTWGFTIFTSDLASLTVAQTLTSLTFQIMAMNKLALGSVSGRMIDAIGLGTNFTPLVIRLDFSKNYTNSVNFFGAEGAGDVIGGSDPAVDITDFSVSVTVP
jgi:hypothetical protein